MKSFRHTQEALRLFVGADCLSLLSAELKRMGCTRAMIFSGRSLAKLGHVSRVEMALGDRHSGSWTSVRTHSPYPTLLLAVEALREARADAIVVLGGGSAVITARAASILMGEGRPLDDICTRLRPDGSFDSPRLAAPKIPLVIVPTTPNSAYVKAGAGVFDRRAGERKAIFDPQTRAKAIFLDPDLLDSAPRDLVLSSTLDNLILAAEGLLSAKGNALSDADLIQSVHLIHCSLLAWSKGADGVDLRLDLALAGIMAGRGTDHAPAGACTALGHAIGANFHCDNAVSKAILWPHVLGFNAASASEGLPKMARALGLPEVSVRAVNAEFRRLFAALSLPTELRTLGIGRSDLPDIVQRAMKDWFMQGNCRRVGQAADLLPALHAAW